MHLFLELGSVLIIFFFMRRRPRSSTRTDTLFPYPPLFRPWPGRLQRLAPGPLTALLPPVTTVWLDGAHNADAGLHLARHFESEPRRIHLITGMLANKQPDAILAPLAGRLAPITAVPAIGRASGGARLCHSV